MIASIHDRGALCFASFFKIQFLISIRLVVWWFIWRIVFLSLVVQNIDIVFIFEPLGVMLGVFFLDHFVNNRIVFLILLFELDQWSLNEILGVVESIQCSFFLVQTSECYVKRTKYVVERSERCCEGGVSEKRIYMWLNWFCVVRVYMVVSSAFSFQTRSLLWTPRPKWIDTWELDCCSVLRVVVNT